MSALPLSVIILINLGFCKEDESKLMGRFAEALTQIEKP